jgi:hypothetical protein
MRLRLEVAALKEENSSLHKVNAMNAEALRETSKIFQSLKPKRPHLGSERKLLVAGQQFFRCAAPHGQNKCPMWILNSGSFDAAGFEVDHVTQWSTGYRHTGQLQAICHACHGLKSRLERIRAAEAKFDEDEEDNESADED